MKREIAKQYRKPTGLFGRYISSKMKKFNYPVYKKFTNWLEIDNNDIVLEIGYGTGDTIKIVGENYPECKIFGIDFSALMLKKAKKLNKSLIKSGRLNFLNGDFISYNFNGIKFTKAYCINVVYFWDDLIPGFKKAFDILEKNGVFGIYMADSEEMLKLEYTKTDIFNKHTIDKVENALKDVGFSEVNIKKDTGNISKSYYIYAKK